MYKNGIETDGVMIFQALCKARGIAHDNQVRFSLPSEIVRDLIDLGKSIGAMGPRHIVHIQAYNYNGRA